MMKRNNKLNRTNRFLVVLSFLLFNGNLFAAQIEESGSEATAMLFVSIFLILISLWLIVVYSELNDNMGDKILGPLKKVYGMLTKSTPIEDEAEILLDHDYDGIRELDSKIPPWFIMLFYGTIIFAAVYLVRFHVIGSGNVQAEEYMEEVKLAQVQRQILIKTGAFLNEETVTQLSDPASLSAGKDIFMKNCASCHGNAGEGLVGPNLTDDYWIHGGGIQNIFKTIKYGVPAKGMISWQSQLAPKKMQEVGSYIMSLHGTNPPNGKEPQGTKYIPEETKEKS